MTEEGKAIVEKVKLKGKFSIAGGGELWTKITYEGEEFFITYGDRSRGPEDIIRTKIDTSVVLEQVRKYFIQNSDSFDSKNETPSDKDILACWEEWPYTSYP